MWEFFGERLALERWEEDAPVPVPVEIEEPDASAAASRR
jgi:hypothetical protein